MTGRAAALSSPMSPTATSTRCSRCVPAWRRRPPNLPQAARIPRFGARFGNPELKSITNYQMLQSQLEGQENRIRIAVRDYNAAVQDYNTEVRTFPTMIGAQLRGAEPLVPYQSVTPGAEVAPSLEGKM